MWKVTRTLEKSKQPRVNLTKNPMLIKGCDRDKLNCTPVGKAMRRKVIIFNGKDNVAVALANLKAKELIRIETGKDAPCVLLIDNIPFGHKFSLTRIKSNSPVIKYGEIIGVASTDIQLGQHVHVHNVTSIRGRGDLAKERKK